MNNINLKKIINRKDLKANAKQLLKENWKLLIPIAIAYFVLLFATQYFIEKLPFAGIINVLFIIPFFLGMYYKFFIEGAYKNKFTFKSIKINWKIYFSNVKLALLLIAICIPVIILILNIYVFLTVNFVTSNTIDSSSLDVNINSTINYLIGLSITSLILFIIYFFILLSFSFTYFYLIDKNIEGKIGVFKALKNSYKLMKGYRFQYIKFLFSFLGWYLLIILPILIFAKGIMLGYFPTILTIISICWVIIGILLLSYYFTICKALFYKELKENFEEN